MQLHDQNLGFDSCGIFYIGGQVEVKLEGGVNGICKLTAVAGPLTAVAGSKGTTLRHQENATGVAEGQQPQAEWLEPLGTDIGH